MSFNENEFIEKVAGPLRGQERFGQAFDDRVMAAVLASPQPVARPEPAWSGAWRWLIQPRTVRLSPVGGFAMAAAVIALLAVALDFGSRDATPQVASVTPAAPAAPIAGAPDTVRVVQFVFVSRDARSVHLVGDFNDWNESATPLEPSATNGVWTVSVPLPAGRHAYGFMIDGSRVVADPAAATTVADEFGSRSSVVTVAETTS